MVVKIVALSVAVLALASCQTPTRQQVEAALWLNNSPIPPELCEREPQLKKYGFYRRLEAGGFEFVSWCDPNAAQWISVYGPQMQGFLDALPDEQPDNPSGG